MSLAVPMTTALAEGLTDTSDCFQPLGTKLEQLSTDLIINKWGNSPATVEGEGISFLILIWTMMKLELQVGLPGADLDPNQSIPNDLPWERRKGTALTSS